jgi:hypothetical protein
MGCRSLGRRCGCCRCDAPNIVGFQNRTNDEFLCPLRGSLGPIEAKGVQIWDCGLEPTWYHFVFILDGKSVSKVVQKSDAKNGKKGETQMAMDRKKTA